MYLSEFRRENVSHRNWTSKVKHEQMDKWFVEIDTVLNSRSDAHALFSHLQSGDRVTHPAHKAFHRVIRHLKPEIPNYPAYQLAYALLRLWIDTREEPSDGRRCHDNRHSTDR